LEVKFIVCLLTLIVNEESCVVWLVWVWSVLHFILKLEAFVIYTYQNELLTPNWLCLRIKNVIDKLCFVW